MGATSHHLFLSNLTTNDVVAPKKIPQISINIMLTANFFSICVHLKQLRVLGIVMKPNKAQQCLPSPFFIRAVLSDQQR